MAEDVSEILKKALALPTEARAALAGSLLEVLTIPWIYQQKNSGR